VPLDLQGNLTLLSGDIFGSDKLDDVITQAEANRVEINLNIDTINDNTQDIAQNTADVSALSTRVTTLENDGSVPSEINVTRANVGSQGASLTESQLIIVNSSGSPVSFSTDLVGNAIIDYDNNFTVRKNATNNTMEFTQTQVRSFVNVLLDDGLEISSGDIVGSTKLDTVITDTATNTADITSLDGRVTTLEQNGGGSVPADLQVDELTVGTLGTRLSDTTLFIAGEASSPTLRMENSGGNFVITYDTDLFFRDAASSNDVQISPDRTRFFTTTTCEELLEAKKNINCENNIRCDTVMLQSGAVRSIGGLGVPIEAKNTTNTTAIRVNKLLGINITGSATNPRFALTINVMGLSKNDVSAYCYLRALIIWNITANEGSIAQLEKNTSANADNIEFGMVGKADGSEVSIYLIHQISANMDFTLNFLSLNNDCNFRNDVLTYPGTITEYRFEVLWSDKNDIIANNLLQNADSNLSNPVTIYAGFE
ncbi:MAG: hypothetical protein AAFO91_04165, partial [Bacteroidota bacterium]